MQKCKNESSRSAQHWDLKNDQYLSIPATWSRKWKKWKQVVRFESDWWQMHHGARWFIHYLCCKVASSCWRQLALHGNKLYQLSGASCQIWKMIDERWLMKDDWWQMHHDARWFIYYLCCEVASSCWWQLALDCGSSRQPWSHHCIHQILNIFEFQSAFWHELIKNKNKNGIFEVVFVCQKWTSIFEFWRFSKMGRHFFRCFWFPIGTRNQEKKQKRHFCFCFWRPFWNDLRPFLIVAQKKEYRDVSGQFFLKSHLIVTKTRNIMGKIFRDRFCHGISADISWPKIF